MIIETLKGKNFKCYAEFDLDFTKSDVWSIIGKTKSNLNRSNGTGKSTIFSAIEYVFFDHHNCKTTDEIVRFEQIIATVESLFSTENGRFKVERSRNRKTSKSDLKLWKFEGETLVSLAQKTNSETEKELQKILGFNYPAFRNAVYFSQEDLKSISNTRSSQERKQIFKEIHRLEIWTALEKLQKEENANLLKQIITITAKIDSFGNINQDILELKEKLEKEQKNLESLLVVKKETDDLLIFLNGEIFVLQNKIPANSIELNLKLDELRNNKRNTQLLLNNTNKTLAAKEKEFSDKKSSFEELVKEQKSLKENLETEKKKKFRDRLKINEEIKCNYTIIANIKALILTTNEKIAELNNPLPNSQVCPACRQPLTPEHLQKCSHEISTQVFDLNLNKTKNEKLLSDTIEFGKTLQKEIDDLDISEKLINQFNSKIENKKSEIKNYQDVAKQLNQLIERIKSEIETISENINDLSSKENEIKSQLSNSDIDSIKKQIEELNVKIDLNKKLSIAQLQQVSKLETTVEFLTKELSIKESKLKELNLLIEKQTILQKEYRIKLEYVQASFHSNEIPTDIIEEQLEPLEIATNTILSQIRPEIQIHIKNSENRESIDIIHKINGKNLVHAQLSNGQKYIVDLSIMIGLAEVMRTSLGIKPGFLEFDEIDQGIDREALENLVKLIHKLRETYVIFIITHNDWMKDQFKSCIVVDGDDVNGSTATMEINA